MQIEFSKMHGLGNDFVIIDATNKTLDLKREWIQKNADRRYGIGFDQLLLLGSSNSNDIDFSFRIFNADGSEAEQCGNGARCIARFINDRALSSKRELIVSTRRNCHELILEDDLDVSVNMRAPIFEPKKIPFKAQSQKIIYTLDTQLGDYAFDISVLSMGNPHCVLIVDDLNVAPIDELGEIISSHPRFPSKTNVEFVQIISSKQIRCQIYERGVGETLACGSGACAAVVAGILQGRLANDVVVIMPGGQLTIQWQGENNPVWMKGPAIKVFDGTIEYE